MFTEQYTKYGVLDGSIPSAAGDMACTSHAGLVGDPFIQTNHKSTKIFALAYGHPTPDTTITLQEHRIREAARTVNMVPEIANKFLLSGGKFAEAGYVSVCNGEEVNISDGQTDKITVSDKSILTGWRCPGTKLWRITLQAQVANPNLHNLLLNGPTGQESFNSLYDVPSSAAVLDHIVLFHTYPATLSPEKEIQNVYELPRIEHTICYLHATSGLPTKSTWIKSIRNGN